MKPRLPFLCAVAALVLSPAVCLSAADLPAIKAFGDTSELPTEKRVREALEVMLPPLNLDGEVTDYDSPAASGSAAQSTGQSAQLPPEVLAQLKPMYEKSIKDLEAQLAKLDPVKNRDERQMLESSLTRTKQTYAEMFGGAPSPATTATPPASKPGKPVLRRPVIGNRIPSFAEAITNLKKMLRDNVSAEALAAFAADPAYQDANRSAAAAAGALMMHRPLAAVAALLRANELEPKKPPHLVNLAGVVTNLGMPRHALALLAEAEKLGKPLTGAFGLNGRAVLLSNRGHALIQMKRFAEAETVLREAVWLAPVLGEARANLALALYAQNDPKKKDEAVQLLRFATRRSVASKPAAPAPTAPPTNPPPAESPEDDNETGASEAADSSGRPAPELVLDMSRPKSGGLPTIKIPRTIMDGAAMWPKVEKLQKETSARLETVTKRMIALDKLMLQRERAGDIPRASARRARDVFWYISNTQKEPRFRSMWRETEKAAGDASNGLSGGNIDNPWGSIELMEKQAEIRARTQPFPATAAQMWEATEPVHGIWQGPIRRIETAVNRYFHETYPHMTAIAANLYEPIYHEYAMLMIETKALALTQDLLGPLHTVTHHDYYFVKAWGPNGKPGEAEDPTEGDYPDADSCPAYLRGEYKVKFDVEIVGFSINCEKVSVEGSLGEWLKLFGEVEATFKGDTTIFVGGATEGEIPIVGGVEAGAKAGAYITFNSKGEIIDVGLKATETSGVSVGPIGYEREIEHTYSFAAAFSDGLP